MWRFVVGTFFGIYLAQTYNLPLVTEQLKEVEKYLNKNKIDKTDESGKK